MQPLVFKPFYRHQIWGGRAFESAFLQRLPTGGLYGEAWQLSAHCLHVSCVSEGVYMGSLLTDLWQKRRREIFGSDGASERFPWLIKFLDCQQALSLQVHPSDSIAAQLYLEEIGKKEAWYILEAARDARIFVGLNLGVTSERLLNAIATQDLTHCLHGIYPQIGDSIVCTPGTVHALAGPILAVEVQTTSDATFRLFDWNRVGFDGRPRPLHLKEAMLAIDWDLGPVTPTQPIRSPLSMHGINVERLLREPEFQLHRFRARREFRVPFDGRMSAWIILNGSARLTGHEYRRCFYRGETVLIPASSSNCEWDPVDYVELLSVTLPIGDSE